MKAFTISSRLMAKHGNWSVEYYTDLVEKGEMIVVDGEIRERDEAPKPQGEQTVGKTWKRMWNDHRFVWTFNAILILYTIPVMVLGIWRFLQ